MIVRLHCIELQAGQVYNFFLSATDSGDAGIKATAGMTVTVESSPLSVSILGGDRVVSQGSSLQVQVGSSLSKLS